MQIYLDNAATTSVSETALQAMLPYFSQEYGNPSSLHSFGQRANEALTEAREKIAALLHCQVREITFTSGGSEADNQAIRSAAQIGARNGKRHIISTAFEHHAVLHTLAKLEKEGFEITLLDVHEDGLVRPQEVEAAIRPDTCLVTVMYANNEIGTIQPVGRSGRFAGKKESCSTQTRYRQRAILPLTCRSRTLTCSRCRPTSSTDPRVWASCMPEKAFLLQPSLRAARRSGASVRARRISLASWEWPRPWRRPAGTWRPTGSG